jgi:hypothetical protein
MQLYNRGMARNFEQMWNFAQCTFVNYVFWSHYVLNRGFISLNSVNQLIVVMVKCGVLFEVRAEYLNII